VCVCQSPLSIIATDLIIDLNLPYILYLAHAVNLHHGPLASHALLCRPRILTASEHLLKKVKVLPGVHVVGVSWEGHKVGPQRVEFKFRQLLLNGLRWDGKQIQFAVLEEGLKVVILDDLSYT
jgi:hypothetical protein